MTRASILTVSVLVAVLVGGATGCSGSSPARSMTDGGAADGNAPEVVFVDPRAAICGDAGSAPSYDLVQQIFDDNCVECHATGADLVLLSGVSWGNLVGKAAPAMEACGGVLVVAGAPSASYLYQKLTLAAPCSGTQMPAGEFGPLPLPACVIAIIQEWIAEGAPGPSIDAGAD